MIVETRAKKPKANLSDGDEEPIEKVEKGNIRQKKKNEYNQRL